MAECPNFDMSIWRNCKFLFLHRNCRLGFAVKVFLCLLVAFMFLSPVASLRPLKERARSWGDEVRF